MDLAFMPETVLRHSALRGAARTQRSGWSLVGSGHGERTGVALHDLGFLEMRVARGDESRLLAASGVSPGDSRRVSDVAMVTAYTAGERLCIAESPEAVGSSIATLSGFEIFDPTAGRSAFRIVGDSADRLLGRVSELALDRSRFINGAAVRGLLGNVTATVNRLDIDGTLSYLVTVRRSLGRYLADLMVEAGHEMDMAWGSPDIALAGLMYLPGARE
jgi:sarcosine oxidase gamma subunit